MFTVGQYFFGKDMGKNLWLTFLAHHVVYCMIAKNRCCHRNFSTRGAAVFDMVFLKVRWT